MLRKDYEILSPGTKDYFAKYPYFEFLFPSNINSGLLDQISRGGGARILNLQQNLFNRTSRVRAKNVLGAR